MESPGPIGLPRQAEELQRGRISGFAAVGRRISLREKPLHLVRVEQTTDVRRVQQSDACAQDILGYQGPCDVQFSRAPCALRGTVSRTPRECKGEPFGADRVAGTELIRAQWGRLPIERLSGYAPDRSRRMIGVQNRRVERGDGRVDSRRRADLYPSLRAVCGTADLLRLGLGLLDRVDHRLWVGRPSHGLSFPIDPVVNQRIIPTGLFQQLDHLRRLLLA